MSAKRKKKSNWYVYLLAFIFTIGIFTFALIMIYQMMTEKDIDGNKQTDQGEFVVDETHNINFLSAISNTSGDAPHTYIIVSYKALDNEINIMSLPSDLKVETGTLTQVFNNSGINGVINAINSTIGINIDKYIHSKKLEFTNAYDSLGTLELTVTTPVTFTSSDSGEKKLLDTGINFLNGSQLYDYLAQVRRENNSYEYMRVSGSAFAEILNGKAKDTKISDIEAIFRRILTTADSNMKTTDLDYRKLAVVDTLEQTATPIVYYVPNGDYDGDSAFVISENSKISIQNNLT